MSYKDNYRSFRGVKALKTITKKDIVNICNQLKIQFEQRYQGQFEFEPEQVDEGGIEMTLWPEKSSDKQYKTIKFMGNSDWPVVEELENWPSSSDEVIRLGTKMVILCKAIDGAVAWKPVEIKLLKQVLANNGLSKN